MRLRDALGPLFDDEQFADCFAAEGRPGTPPGTLALVSVLQAMENLTDRAAAEAVRTRLDWKYALSMELDDPGFDFSVLSEFRDRLLSRDRSGWLLELMLQRVGQAGLLVGRGKVRPDSTHVLTRTRTLNRLELLGESVRAALEQLAQIAPGWLAPRIQPGWDLRYGHRIESSRLPAGEGARLRWGQETAADGALLLEAIDTDPESA
ncbi:transposase [Streptosporangium sp. NPDC087985]|uniref:transposase n=1 Tax=Streptosporangium sp. NPDC087985 TaxID=3366196 RepID=UPI0037F83711